MKIRTVPSSNYKGIFLNSGETIRYQLDESKPILPLEHPDLVDISLGTICDGGCPYCYANALKNGVFYTNVIRKIKTFFAIKENRPFQAAIGGSGEPTMHPDFVEVIKTFASLGILPNYTTNGKHLSDEILSVTEELCGGVAVSAHQHIDWVSAVYKLLNRGITTNLHIVVGEENSVKLVNNLFNIFGDEIKTYVLLPYQSIGRAQPVFNINEELKEVSEYVINHEQKKKFAFGALFYDFITDSPELFKDISIYEPHMFSAYLPLDDDMKLRVSSFDTSIRN